MRKQKNYLECTFIVVSIIMLFIVLFYFLTSYKTVLSSGYIIRRTGVIQRLSLCTPKNKKIITGISDWIETDRYIYGYGDGSKFNYYIYDMKLNDTFLFDDGFDGDSFYHKLQELNLRYNMTDCHSVENPLPPVWQIWDVIVDGLLH